MLHIKAVNASGRKAILGKPISDRIAAEALTAIVM